jgi:hypothetical protein
VRDRGEVQIIADVPPNGVTTADYHRWKPRELHFRVYINMGFGDSKSFVPGEQGTDTTRSKLPTTCFSKLPTRGR